MNRILTALGIIIVLSIVGINGWYTYQMQSRLDIITKQLDQLRTEESSANSLTKKSTVSKETYRFAILMYHHVRDYNNPSDAVGMDLSVSPVNFEKQLQTIKDKGFTTVNMEEYAKEQIPTKAIILSFDDGYDNFYTTVFPLLKQQKMKAVLYIIRNKVNSSGYVTAAQIDEMSKSGLVEIGSHTISHPNLTNISLVKAQDEITQSKKSANTFCYPSGQFNSDVIDLVRLAGYTSAVTTLSGYVTNNSSPFALPRMRMKPNTDIIEVLNGVKNTLPTKSISPEPTYE